MLYVDTSMLLPLFVAERASNLVRQWFDIHSSDVLAVSDWTRVEFASALGVRVRQRTLPVEQARQARRLFDVLIEESFRILAPGRGDFACAVEFLADHALGLRAGDALHLAVAVGAGVERVYSLDGRFVDAGRRLEVETVLPTAPNH